MLITIRRVGACLLAAAAIAVFFLLAPKPVRVPDAADHEGDIAAVQSDYESNNSRSQYIYGQIFAAGSATKDMLAVLARESDAAAQHQVQFERALAERGPDQRIPAELLLIALGGALFLATTQRPGPDVKVAATEPVAESLHS